MLKRTAIDASVCTLCRVPPTAMPGYPEESCLCGRVPCGYQHMREGALLKGKATLSTAAFLLQVCVARGLGEVEGRCDRWRSNRERKAAVKIIQCLMCGRKGLDVFRCSGHSVQPFT